MQKILSKTKKITNVCGKSTSGTSSVTDIHPSASSSTSTIAVSASSATSGSTELDYENITEQQEEIYSNDIGDWNICDALREYFCENGVTNCQHMDSDFSASEKICPGETFTRHCTKSLFFREQLNGEKVKRDWLCYSPKTGKVFCALCKLFSKDKTTHLTSTGYSDWRHATRDLSRHENSASHGKAIEVLIRRKTSGQRIDKDLVNQFENQKKYWHKILCRILSVIKLLSSRGLSFQGSNEVIGSVHNGNYLGCLELLAEYDPFLAEHIQKHGNKGRGHISYLSSTICDEFIKLIGQQLLQQIVNDMKQAKYYSISVDSTPDIAHSDQLTIIFRYVLASGPVERFTKFIPISGHTGMKLANTVLQFLEENGISIKDCRGQSYDNASNMSGKYNAGQRYYLLQLQCGRKIKRNKKWDYGDADDADMTPSEKFKVNTFYLIIDQLTESLRHRQAAYSVIQERFSLLLEMCTLATDGLCSKARTLVTQYPEDLDPLFADEIVQFASLFKMYQSSPAKKVINESQELQMYKFLVTQSLVGAFPNTHVTLRMYLCLMVSNCSGERSFSILKRVKNELRSSMGQERLNALSLLCIENGLLNELNLDSTIEEFASKKARKANL
ncbi:zinc finger MYM-type 1-like [Pelobates cultripes]|uniref:Zinc finger MYM-type 1-like n=1 Tax=Pelobates cultripes TaxID=61616 RepID=A0AAD1VY70_PELCU|nr:zinc finger MYM-type 1-like [Pelobates cultripes]